MNNQETVLITNAFNENKMIYLDRSYHITTIPNDIIRCFDPTEINSLDQFIKNIAYFRVMNKSFNY